MRVTCLVDNEALPGLRSEHGLSFLIDTPDGSVLFDTGASGDVLLHNMRELGIAPQSIDAVAISHAHRDHTGGLEALLSRTRPGIPLYAHPDLFRRRFSRRKKKLHEIGMPQEHAHLESRVTLRLSAEPQEMMTNLWTSGEVSPRPMPEGRSARHMAQSPEGLIPDPYRDDMSLALIMPAGLALLCGCCHAGLLNTIVHVERVFRRPVVLIAGGTHLVSADDEHLARVVGALRERESIRYVYLNHCSGDKALKLLARELGPRVRPCPAGTEIDLEEFT